MIKSGIQYHVNRQLPCNLKLILPQVDSIAGCTLSHFTTLKSATLVGFATLPRESATVSHTAGAPRLALRMVASCKLRAALNKLRAASWMGTASWTCELQATLNKLDVQFI